MAHHFFNKEKKGIIIATSIISIIVLSVVIFCSVYFTVKFDLNDKIEDYFAVSDTVEFTYGGCMPTPIYEVQSSVAKQIILKHLKDKKFKNNNDFRVLHGTVFLSFDNGDKDFSIASFKVNFYKKFNACYLMVNNLDNLDEIAQELIAVSTIIQDGSEE